MAMYRGRYGTFRCSSNLLLIVTLFLTTAYLLFLRVSDNVGPADNLDTSVASASTIASDLEAEDVIEWLTDHGHKPQLPPTKNSKGKWVGTPAREYEDPLEKEFWSWRAEDYYLPPKPASKERHKPSDPISDPFPLLSTVGNTSSEIARLQAWLQPISMNRPPQPHVAEATPLLIGFTRNWPQLLQCISSYIAAGWPPEDIHVVENTGVMNSNRNGKLTLQNPFYLNHTQLSILGVNVIITPTILTFAQLQNFYAWTALDRGWAEFFWSHEDIIVFSHEDEPLTDDLSQGHTGIDSTKPSRRSSSSSSSEKQPYLQESYSLYTRCLSILRYLRSPRNSHTKWANYFFAYDHLTLVHTSAIIDVGGWDTHIPFYASDCDMYDRLMFAGYWQGEGASASVGLIFDVSTTLTDIAAIFRIPGVRAEFPGDPWSFAHDGKLSEYHFFDRVEGDESLPRYNLSPEQYATVQQAHIASVADSGEDFHHLLEQASRMVAIKYYNGGEDRNKWQLSQQGGQGEPFYRDAQGFQWGLQLMIDGGRAVFAEKWGHRGCDIAWMGVVAEDAWRIERDWDQEVDGAGWEGPSW